MKLINALFLIIILICPSISYAGSYLDDFFEAESVSFVSSLYTKHIAGQTFKDEKSGLERDYNESNDYFSLKVYLKNDYKISVSRFNNSYYQESYALGLHKDLFEPNKYISFGAELLITSGYEKHLSLGLHIVPVPSVYMRVDIEEFSVKISLLSGSVIGVTGEYRFYMMR